ncbi:MAG: lipoyltransferase [Muribaculaceae bacterium]|nr:lipoyltransferase [Muribaculaceae bacterium]
MKYLQLPDATTRILPFYLAMEEYAVHIMGDEDVFFMWQVQPTVIFGRNQLIDTEVNLPYCQSHGIATYRRKSGGGCVYADMNNIMFSYITRSDNVQFTFGRYTQAVVGMLRELGLDACDNGRNDILVDGKKVSGNAFYHLPGHSIVHGTMLFDTDMEHMTRAITPSNAKLESKGVESVRSRITTLNSHLTLSIDEFKQYVRQSLCDGEILLTAADVTQIEQMTESYLSPEFIYGNNPRCNLTRRARIEGVGELAVSLELNRNTIRHIDVAGDFFVLGDIDRQVFSRLKGVPLDADALRDALCDVRVEQVVMNLSNEQFINLLTNQ